MISLKGWKLGFAPLVICAVTTTQATAQSFKKLLDFNGPNGALPYVMALVQGRDGAYYGTTMEGGIRDLGTVFKISADGTLATLHSFSAYPDGSFPTAGLVLGTDGNFYGTTQTGGTDDKCSCGTVFKISPNGAFATLHSFSLTEGAFSSAALVQGTDGDFYGATAEGGDVTCNPPGGCGSLFRISANGEFAVLYIFDGSDGSSPMAGLIQGRDGFFYGTTACGGENGSGTVYKVTSHGVLTTLHSFDVTDGALPFTRLIQDAAGTLYGTTEYGGPNGNTCCGTIFDVTTGGTLTTLYYFSNSGYPVGDIVEGFDGNLYGTTSDNFAYKWNPTGLTRLYKFCSQENCVDGQVPGGLLESTTGMLYGTTRDGGNFGRGTVFSLDVGFHPFVAFVRDSGKVGGVGGILGQSFTGATDVSLNGILVRFQVISDTFIKAQVPNGATSGFIAVTTPNGTLTSNKIFRVIPQLLSFDPPSGPVGTQVTITGVSLTQTEGVGFGNRDPAQFTVNSDTQVSATVPQGAKTGRIGIETTGGTAISAGTFTVTQ